MKKNAVLKSALAKLTECGERYLNSKRSSIEWFDSVGNAEDVCGNKGCVAGYLNALVHMGVIERNEAMELYQCFTK